MNDFNTGVEAFFANLNWKVIEGNFARAFS